MVGVIIFMGVDFIFYKLFQTPIEKGYQYAGRKAAPLTSKIFAIPIFYKELLEKYFRYYQQLSPENKRKFEQKLCGFLYSKQFIPRYMPEGIPIEMRVFISATAVQLTFGLPHIYLQHFSKILVYPDDYYSSITRRYHKGEVNPAYGIIVLSWENFKDGFLFTDDAINLGLHEMAHALRLENIIRNEEYQFFDETLLQRFDQIADNICNDPEGSKGFIRPYACTDVHEFFSVCVENFFERSVMFKEHFPDLYLILSRLLAQDPIELTSNP